MAAVQLDGDRMDQLRSRRQREVDAEIDQSSGVATLRRSAKVIAHRLADLSARCLVPSAVTDLPFMTLTTNPVSVAALPRCLRGLRILHLSDLHLESLGDTRFVRTMLRSLDFSVCVVTGDIASGRLGQAAAAAYFADFRLDHPAVPVFAVLGNHDRSDLVEILTRAGVQVLANESRQYRNLPIWFAGVDDPSYFKCHDVDLALRSIPSSATTILLAHSPDAATEVAQVSCDLYLCGHTHGGHWRLWDGTRLGFRTRYPSERLAGSWRIGRMWGYTSSGLGSGVGVCRLNCPPEVVVHILAHG